MTTQFFDGPVVFRNGIKYTDTISTSIVSTTSSVPTNAYTITATVGTNTTYVYEGTFTGFIVTGPNANKDVFIKYTVMITNLNGVMTVYKSSPGNIPMLILRDGDSTLDNCSIDAIPASNVVNIRITGLAVTQINWGITHRLVQYSH